MPLRSVQDLPFAGRALLHGRVYGLDRSAGFLLRRGGFGAEHGTPVASYPLWFHEVEQDEGSSNSQVSGHHWDPDISDLANGGEPGASHYDPGGDPAGLLWRANDQSDGAK